MHDVDSACSKLTGMKYLCFSNRQFDTTNAFVVSITEMFNNFDVHYVL